MKNNTVESVMSKSYSEKKFQIDFNDEVSLGKLFQSLIMIYKDKFSFVREFVQNAYDAVVEVWENDYQDSISLDNFLIQNPIIVSLYKDNKGNYFEVKETKGIGISPERMDNMFLFLTKSTKHNSLNQIGAKGIGKMAALSYTDEYFVSTIHDSFLYEYKISWYNQQGIPTLSDPVITKTKEHSGTTIRVYLKTEDDTDKILKSVKRFLSYFNNIYYNNIILTNKYYLQYEFERNGGNYISNNTDKSSLNKCVLHNYETFLYRENIDIFEKKTFLVVDRIPYEIDWDLINENPIYLPFGIKVSSAEVLLNDNRDSVRYTDAVIKIVKNKILAFKKELLSFIHKGITTHTDDFNSLWGKSTYLVIKDVSFKLTENPLAYWTYSRHYVESLENISFKALIKNLFNVKLIVFKDKKMIRSNLVSYDRLIDSHYGRYATVCKNHYLVINDIDVNVDTIGLANLNINNNIVLIDNIKVDNIKKIELNITDDNNFAIIKNHISNYFNTKVVKLSSIYDKKKKIKTFKKTEDSKFKIANLDAVVQYYNHYTNKSEEYTNYDKINKNYVIFSSNDVEDAKKLSMLLKKFNINTKVSIVAPTFYKKIDYNFCYFLQSSEEFKQLRIMYECYKIYKETFSYFFDIIYDTSLINFRRNYKDTIVCKIVDEIVDKDKSFFTNMYIFEQGITFMAMLVELETNYKHLFDLVVLDDFLINKFKELVTIFNSSFEELHCINYKKDHLLINKTVKIILNKNNNV